MEGRRIMLIQQSKPLPAELKSAYMEVCLDENESVNQMKAIREYNRANMAVRQMEFQVCNIRAIDHEAAVKSLYETRAKRGNLYELVKPFMFYNPILSNRCRYCGDYVNLSSFATATTYWNPITAPCHEDCKKEGEIREAINCQNIDKDCNYCVNYHRGREKIIQGVGHGICGLTNEHVISFLHDGELRTCFKNRRLLPNG